MKAFPTYYYALAFAAAALAVLPLAIQAVRILARVWDRAGGNKTARWVFLTATCLAAQYAITKHYRAGGISFPYTDQEIRYLVDAGSYVTNDAVHVAFTRVIAPASAPLLIDRRRVDQTNEVDWVNFTNTTFAAFANPCDIPFAAATNFDWIVYTTWTPGPSVQTNGVWHAYWGKDRKTHAYFIPVRTCVREGPTIIATPKSVWDATNTTNEVSQ